MIPNQTEILVWSVNSSYDNMVAMRAGTMQLTIIGSSIDRSS